MATIIDNYLECLNIQPKVKKSLLNEPDSYFTDIKNAAIDYGLNMSKKDIIKFVRDYKIKNADSFVDLFNIKNLKPEIDGDIAYWNFLGVFRLSILTPATEKIFELKLTNVNLKPAANAIELEFDFFNNFEYYNPFCSPFIGLYKKIIDSLPARGGKKYCYLNNYNDAWRSVGRDFSLNLKTRELIDECAEIYKHFEIIINYKNKKYAVGYKMDLIYDERNRWSNNKNFVHLACQNFTILNSKELVELEEDYKEFNSDNSSKFNHSFGNMIEDLKAGLDIKVPQTIFGENLSLSEEVEEESLENDEEE